MSIKYLQYTNLGFIDQKKMNYGRTRKLVMGTQVGIKWDQ